MTSTVRFMKWQPVLLVLLSWGDGFAAAEDRDPELAMKIARESGIPAAIQYLRSGNLVAEVEQLRKIMADRREAAANAASRTEAEALNNQVIAGLRLIVAARSQLAELFAADNEVRIGECLNEEGVCLLSVRRIEESRAAFDQAIRLLTGAGEEGAHELGRSYYLRVHAISSVPEKLQTLQTAVSILSGLQRAPYLPESAASYAEALKREGQLQRAMGNIARARLLAEQALTSLNTHCPGRQPATGMVEELLARVLVQSAEFERANELVDRIQQIANRQNDRKGKIQVARLREEIHERLGHWVAAEELQRTLIRMYGELNFSGDLVYQRLAKIYHARTLTAIGRNAEARDILTSVLKELADDPKADANQSFIARLQLACIDFDASDPTSTQPIERLAREGEQQEDVLGGVSKEARRVHLDSLLLSGQYRTARVSSLLELETAIELASMNSRAFSDAELLHFTSTIEPLRSRFFASIPADDTVEMESLYRTVWSSEAVGTRLVRNRRLFRQEFPDGEYQKLLTERAERLGIASFTGANLDDLRALDQRITDLERSVPQQTASVGETRSRSDEFLQLMPPGSALIHIVRTTFVPSVLFGAKTGRELDEYMAFIVRRSGSAWTARLVRLGNAAAIDEAVQRTRETTHERLLAVRGIKVPGSRNPSTTTGSSAAVLKISELVWRPLAELVADCHQLCIIPGSKTALIPWNGLYLLKDGRPEWVIQRHTICLAQCPDLLVNSRATPVPSDRSIMAVGGLDYGSRDTWEELPATLAEVQSITAEFNQSENASTSILTGDAADREVFLSQLEHNSTIHIATHFQCTLGGIETQAGAEAAKAIGRNCFVVPQVILSHGVAVSGAEVLGRDLSKVNLAVLSGCESSPGPAPSGEGVVGMQRVFRIAGARCVVASLWKVTDNETSILMKRFYGNLRTRAESPAEALRSAQLQMFGTETDPETAAALYGAWTIDGTSP